MVYQNPRYRIMGDRALIVELGDRISPELNQRVRKLALVLADSSLEGLLEIVPTYRSLLVIYDPLKMGLKKLQHRIENLQKKIDGTQIPEPKTAEVPVLYCGEYGPDLGWVAEYHKISPKEVIRLHSGTTYQVYMIGFNPGFPYMGELPKRLVTPRRETPRTLIPAGSVAIAQKQTGIYPAESPGGWQVIGRTPLKLFDPSQSPPTLLAMGDRVRFFPISNEEFESWPR